MSTATSTRIPVEHVSAMHVAARTARAIATAIALPAPLPERAAVVASELAGNLDKHAWDGTVYLQPLLLGAGIDVTAVDRGPGMVDIDYCLTDGHTTTGTLGVGLGAVRRMATEFVINSTPADGTLVSARLRAPGGSRAPLDLGHLVVAADGEEHCGDVLAAAETEAGEWTLLLADGLGHGGHAAEAAVTAELAFHRDPAGPLPRLMTTLHEALRHTRGAAVALVRMWPTAVSFCGIGNITTVVLTGVRNHHLLSAPGVAGLRAGTPVQQDVPVPPGSTVVLHSDGLDNRWSLGPPTTLGSSAQLAAARLLRDHRHHADDASVLVARLPEPPQ